MTVGKRPAIVLAVLALPVLAAGLIAFWPRIVDEWNIVRLDSKEEAVRYADLLAQVATVPKAMFGEGTDKVGETRAKPEIWTKRADFDEKMNKMIEETGKLPSAAASGDVAALRKAVQAADDACKACHDEYRTKQR